MAGYVAGLRDAYRLVLFDARGHGQSATPHDPAAYRCSLLAADVLAVLDEIGLASAALCGWSLGAAVALRIAACYPHRVNAVAAIGANLGWVGFADVPPGAADDTWAPRFEREGMAWMVANLEREGRPELARLVAETDPAAMAALLRGMDQVEPTPQRLKDLAVPSLFAWGEQELREGDEALLPAQARFVVVPGADHVGAFQRSDLLIPEIRSLLAQVRSAPVTAPVAH
jgi:pimeloyl-ACP methyl ester carboxylesterase